MKRIAFVLTLMLIAAVPVEAQNARREAARRGYEDCREREREKNGTYRYELVCKDRGWGRDHDDDSDGDSDEDGAWRRTSQRRGSASRPVCVDRNRDGRCDYVARRAEVCIDRNRDGWCDNDRDRRVDRRSEEERRAEERRRNPKGIDDLIAIMRERRGQP